MSIKNYFLNKSWSPLSLKKLLTKIDQLLVYGGLQIPDSGNKRRGLLRTLIQLRSWY